MESKDCFVVMPIKKDTSEEYRHYKTLYDEWIKPIPEGKNYKVIRADDIQRSGLITQDVILGLASADLVIADLTDLNPNVFYELGVRHALRGQGTIMLLDESRTQDVPFDISPYRVIKFTSDMYGLSNLRNKLNAYIDGLPSEATIEAARDNPVHDSIPSLPLDILSSSTGSEEGRLREQLTNVYRELQQYRQRFGEINQDREPESPGYRIQALLQQVREGSFGPDLVNNAHAAAVKQDKDDFLNLLRRIVQDSSIRLDGRAYLSLISDATGLGLNEAASILFTVARRVHPNDLELRSSELATLAHSFEPSERRRARDELLSYLGLRIEDGNIIVPDTMDSRQSALCGVMLDAYHEDNMNGETLHITEALIQKFPDNSVMVRNHARSLQRNGQETEALEWFQRAMWCSNADDTSAVWFGSEMHNRRRYVDALEAYSLACVLDPDDATNFAHVADEISRGMDERDELEYQASTSIAVRALPDEINSETLGKAIFAAFCCKYLNQDDIDRCVSAANRAGMDQETVAIMLSVRSGNQIELGDQVFRQLSLSQRRRFAYDLRKLLIGPLTRKPNDLEASIEVDHS
jgi:tetratricopeptide (TPR) repeat protein